MFSRVDAVEVSGPPTLLVHGLGLGPWMWERDQQLLKAQGVSSWAMQLPGHGTDAGAEVSLDELVQAVRAAHDEIAEETGQKVAIVGHSLGGLVAQMLFDSLDFQAAVLMCPSPPAGVSFSLDRTLIKAGLRSAPSFLKGQPIRISLETYATTAMTQVEPAEHAAVHGRLTPWPNGLVRSLVRSRPTVAPIKPDFPVLVVLGGDDRVTQPQTVRAVGDWYESVVWRFDGVGHLPPLESGGERMMNGIADFLLQPFERRIHGSEAFAPQDGAGTLVREVRDQSRPKIPWTRTRLGGQSDRGRKVRKG